MHVLCVLPLQSSQLIELTRERVCVVCKVDFYTLYQKVITFVCYNFDVHQPILIILGRNVAKNVSNCSV